MLPFWYWLHALHFLVTKFVLFDIEVSNDSEVKLQQRRKKVRNIRHVLCFLLDLGNGKIILPSEYFCQTYEDYHLSFVSFSIVFGALVLEIYGTFGHNKSNLIAMLIVSVLLLIRIFVNLHLLAQMTTPKILFELFMWNILRFSIQLQVIYQIMDKLGKGYPTLNGYEEIWKEKRRRKEKSKFIFAINVNQSSIFYFYFNK